MHKSIFLIIILLFVIGGCDAPNKKRTLYNKPNNNVAKLKEYDLGEESSEDETVKKVAFIKECVDVQALRKIYYTTHPSIVYFDNDQRKLLPKLQDVSLPIYIKRCIDPTQMITKKLCELKTKDAIVLMLEMYTDEFGILSGNERNAVLNAVIRLGIEINPILLELKSDASLSHENMLIPLKVIEKVINNIKNDQYEGIWEILCC